MNPGERTMTLCWKTCSKTIMSIMSDDLIYGGNDVTQSCAILPPHMCPLQLRLQREKTNSTGYFNPYSVVLRSNKQSLSSRGEANRNPQLQNQNSSYQTS